MQKKETEVFSYPILISHSKKELKAHDAGAFVVDPESLSEFTPVVVYEKGSKNWWQRGEIAKEGDRKFVNVFDGEYSFSQVEVYLDARYRRI